MGKLTSAWEMVTGRNPKQAVIENLPPFRSTRRNRRDSAHPGAAAWTARSHRQGKKVAVWRDNRNSDWKAAHCKLAHSPLQKSRWGVLSRPRIHGVCYEGSLLDGHEY